MLKFFFISCFLGLFVVSCDDGTQKKTEITQQLCEGLTNRTDCVAAGCTYTCGMVLMEHKTGEIRTCVKRRNAGRCLAVIKLVLDDMNNNDYEYSISPQGSDWLSEFVQDGFIENVYTGYREYFRIENPYDYPLEVLGHRSYAQDFGGGDFDPCSVDDPDETLFPWEGSCETDWWSDTMWDDVLP